MLKYNFVPYLAVQSAIIVMENEMLLCILKFTLKNKLFQVDIPVAQVAVPNNHQRIVNFGVAPFHIINDIPINHIVNITEVIIPMLTIIQEWSLLLRIQQQIPYYALFNAQY